MREKTRPSHKDDNHLFSIKEFEDKKTSLLSYPQTVFIELTLNCNLHCHMCRSKGYYLPYLNMPIGLFRDIADQLFPYVKIVDLRGSGESTILANFLEFVEYAINFDVQLKLVTNLTVKNNELWDVLMENRFILAVSFDGASEKTFEELRAGSNFKTIIKNLKYLSLLSEKYDLPSDNLYLTTVVQAKNLSEIPDIIRLANELGIQRIKLFPIKCSEASPDHLSHYPQQVKQMLDNSLLIANNLGILLELSASLLQDLAIDESIPRPCTHPWMYCYIDYQGGVGFCDHLVGKPQYTLGNFKEQSFMEIWNSPRFIQLREEHVSNNISLPYSPCRWCYSNRYIDLEHLYYPKYKNLIVSNITRKEGLYKTLPSEDEDKK